MEKLIKLQNELKAPKSKRNDFAGFDYRSAEDILKAVKPLLKKHNLYLNLSDKIIETGTYIIVEATATITDVFPGVDKGSQESVFTKGYAAVDVNRKKVTVDQCFGAASSFARKYALNGLLLIDDSASDPDNEKMMRSGAEPARKATAVEKKTGSGKKKVMAGTAEFNKLMKWIESGNGSLETAIKTYDIDAATINIIKKQLNNK